MPSSDSPIITRFAPSPTGHLHVGGARTALFCWAFARRMGGLFLLRIEDTDQARSSEASARGILEDLAWLGIDWDEGPVHEASGQWAVGSGGGQKRSLGGDPRAVGPFFQSQRLDLYNQHINDMLDRGLAYADFTSHEQMAQMRKAAEAAKQTFRFHPADAEILPPAEQRARIRDGVAHVVRFRAQDEPVRVTDEVLGEVSFGPGEVDDFVLRKADGFPTYHFGVVIDDQLMGVTHVLRGQEHLMNTPRHVALQKALGFRVPVYAHMPLIFNDQGAKMSKRERDKVARDAVKQKGLKDSPVSAIDGETFRGWLADSKRQLETQQLEMLAQSMQLRLPEVSVHDFRAAGYLPEVVCNFIALLGWNPGVKNADGTDLERFDMEFLARNFDLSRIGKTNARFDRKKLLAFNGDALAALTDDAFTARWLAWAQACDRPMLDALGADRLAAVAPMVRPRCKTLADASGVVAFLLMSDDAIAYDEAAVKKHLRAGQPSGLDVLRDFLPVLREIDPFTPDHLNSAIDAFAQSRGVGMGHVAQPLRVALTGAGVSPSLGDTLAALGKASTVRRVERCVAVHS